MHAPIGKVSFTQDKLVENFKAMNDVIVKARPASAKGQYIKSLTVTSTFGPGVHVNAAEF